MWANTDPGSTSAINHTLIKVKMFDTALGDTVEYIA